MTKPIMINLPEVIETSRLKLHMPQAGWGIRLHEAITDGYEDYVHWLNWPAINPSIEFVEEECRRHHSEFIMRDFIRYIIVEKESNQVIGRCGFPPFQAFWNIPQFGISYFVRRSARQQGYATEAAQALTTLAFRVLGAKKVEIYCDAENKASQKIPQKLGFIFECSKKGGWPRQDNQLAELLTYSLFSESTLLKIEE